MKNRKRKILLILVIFTLIIILFLPKKYRNNLFQDELIFFKLFSSEQKENKNTVFSENQTYYFKVDYKNIDFKNIYLADTIKPKNLIREKIAPGTEGSFEIVLQSKQKINYQIKFKSTNEKPKNLNFRLEGKDKKYEKLEDLETELKGEIKGNKQILINWKWEYEKDKTEDLQDTKDGETIRKYNFIIYTIGG